jgi:hypothetical protein
MRFWKIAAPLLIKALPRDNIEKSKIWRLYWRQWHFILYQLKTDYRVRLDSRCFLLGGPFYWKTCVVPSFATRLSRKTAKSGGWEEVFEMSGIFAPSSGCFDLPFVYVYICVFVNYVKILHGSLDATTTKDPIISRVPSGQTNHARQRVSHPFLSNRRMFPRSRYSEAKVIDANTALAQKCTHMSRMCTFYVRIDEWSIRKWRKCLLDRMSAFIGESE